MAGSTGHVPIDDQAIAAAIESFWRDGLVGTTTRSLQRDMRLDADEIEKAFGTKKALRNRAIDAYLDRVEAQLVAPLDTADAGLDELCGFYDGVKRWVTNPKHPGCMLVNLLGESGPDDEFLSSRTLLLRRRVESVFGTLLARVDQPTATQRTRMLIAAFFGICLIARSGVGEQDVELFVSSTQAQIRSWGA